jgi:hypothetical protein
MGTVFKARHEHLERVVALKRIRRDRHSEPQVVERFRREAKATARLSHPNIVQVHDADEQDGQLYYVMEYFAGVTLADHVAKRGPLPISEACDVIRQAALGLQHAHERGLIHRDIKPSNLLLAGGVIKVLDLGIARIDPGWGDTTTGSLTQTGAVMGTPDYIAPEQCRDASTVDIRADIYSLGCTLYFLLTGHAPFPGGSTAQKLACHLHAEPAPVQELRADIPGELTATLRRMMDKAPEKRFPTPGDVAAQLATFSTGTAVPPALPTVPATLPTGGDATDRPAPAPRTALPAKKRWLLPAVGAGVLLAVVGIWLIVRDPGTERQGGPGIRPDQKQRPPDKDRTPPLPSAEWPSDLQRPLGVTQTMTVGNRFVANHAGVSGTYSLTGHYVGDEASLELITMNLFDGEKQYQSLDEVPESGREVARTLFELARRRIFNVWK